MNKRGFIKTVEAIIAILLIFIFVYYITPRVTGSEEVKGIKSLQTEILKGVSEDEDFRKCIVEDNFVIDQGTIKDEDDSICEEITKIDMKNFITEGLPPKYSNKYKLDICETGTCGEEPNGPPNKDTVYTSAVIVTSSIKTKEYKPKIVRLYLW